MRAASPMNESERTELVRTLVEQSGPSAPPTRQDLGLLGHVFGARYASTNITGIVIVAVLVLLFLDRFATEHPGSRELVTGAFSVISLALGYLFGSSRPRA